MSEDPVAVRGHNLVVAAPPSPAYGAAALSGIIARLSTEHPGVVLALAPDTAIGEWAAAAERLAAGTPVRIAGAHSPGRLTRLLKSDTVDLVFTSPDTALDLTRRSALKMGESGGVLIVWPECWEDTEALAALLQDTTRETQRIVVTSDPSAAAAVIERYCWKAPVADLMGGPPGGSVPEVRTTPVAWTGRASAVVDLIEQLDPASLAIWTADATDHDLLRRSLRAGGSAAEITTGVPAAAALVVAYDLPTPAKLVELAAAGPVVLLVPPGAEGYVARIAAKRRPIHLTGALDRARSEVDASRRTIAEAVERAPAGAFLAIAPLLERHEATAVAAALYDLWQNARKASPAPEPKAAAPAGPGTKLWIGIGKRDGATPNDVVGSLVKECHVPREAVGRIELRETFSLVELEAQVNADEVAERMAGKSIRKRRLVVRVDQGRPAGKDRPRR
ncbi:MAG: hypothetical protein HOP28_05015 [Gemmatimonadales bacterium]|nr:hypothetical protein [Gemmatimonadales bacterium]